MFQFHDFETLLDGIKSGAQTEGPSSDASNSNSTDAPSDAQAPEAAPAAPTNAPQSQTALTEQEVLDLAKHLSQHQTADAEEDVKAIIQNGLPDRLSDLEKSGLAENLLGKVTHLA